MFPSGGGPAWAGTHPGHGGEIYLTQGYTPSGNGLLTLPPFVCIVIYVSTLLWTVSC